MPLFRLTVTYDIVVNLESREKAYSNAGYLIRNEVDDDPTSIDVEEVKSDKDLPPEWDSSLRPWGDRDPDDRMIHEFYEENS